MDIPSEWSFTNPSGIKLPGNVPVGNYLLIPPEVLLSLIKFPKVFPPSVLVLITGLSAPVSFVHHVTTTLLPDAPIVTFPYTTSIFGFVLGLRTIVFANVFPPSLLCEEYGFTMESSTSIIPCCIDITTGYCYWQ